MIPLMDRNPSSRTPYVTYTLLGLNIAVFLFELTLDKEGLEGLFDRFGVIPVLYTQGGQTNLFQLLIPLFTSMFLHAGWVHLGFNMLYLWIFADNVEDRLGHVRFVIFYLLSGLGAMVAQIALSRLSAVPCIGASGAIGGVLGAYMITYPNAKVLTLLPIFYFITLIEVPALVVLGFWFVGQFFSGVGSLNPEGGAGIAYWAHVGGFATGIALMFVLAPGRDKELRKDK